MPATPGGGTDSEHPYDDLSYDMAHEEVPVGDDAPAEAPPAKVATQTPDTEGDYSYDLAHDIPRAEAD